MIFNINTDGVVRAVNKLEKLHRSALPVSVRQTLNDAAFYTKQKSMPAVTQAIFKKRQPNFFKANSRVEMAQGFKITTMKSQMGFYENKLQKQATNYAVKDLEQREYGGRINKKTFIAQKGARGGRGLVRKEFIMDEIKPNTVIMSRRMSKSKQGKSIKVSKKQAFIRAAIKAKELHGNKAYVLGNTNSKGNKTLSLIKNLRLTKGKYTFAGKGGGQIHSISKISIERLPLYSYRKGRFFTVKQSNFMKRASHEANLHIEAFFIKRAQAQFEKYGLYNF